MSVRVLLVDDHKIVREGLRSLLEQQPGVEVVGEAGNGRRAVQLARELSPDIVILDITMPDLTGVEATREIIADNPKVKVIGLSVHCELGYVTEMLQAGASGYLVKDCAFEELSFAIEAVSRNRRYLSPSIAHIVLENNLCGKSDQGLSVFCILTSREREVLQLLSEGKIAKEIAAVLNLSPKTIETHRQKIMDKLDIHTLAGLTKYAIREGLTPLES